MKFLAILLLIAVTVSAKTIVDNERDQLLELIFKLSSQGKALEQSGPVTPINKVFCGCNDSEKCSKIMSTDDKLNAQEEMSFKVISLLSSIFVPQQMKTEIKTMKNEETIQKCPEQLYKIECEADQKIKIFKATISNAEKSKCPATWSSMMMKGECTESENSKELMMKMCDGQRSCEFSVDKHFGSMCECYEQKYLDVVYSCEPKEESEMKDDDEAVKQRAKRSLLYFMVPEEYSESYSEYRPAEYKESSEYRRPAEYRESSEYRRPAEYRESSEYRRPTEYRRRRPYESKRRYHDDYYYDDYYYDDYYYDDYYYDDYYNGGIDLVEDYIFGPFNRFHGHGGWGNFYDYFVENSEYNREYGKEYGNDEYARENIRGPGRRIDNFRGYEYSREN